jgi:DNA-binding MarR family transcriptional regulator
MKQRAAGTELHIVSRYILRTDASSMTSTARSGAQHPKRLLSDAEYRQLADFRYAIRSFMEFSEQAARNAGLTPQQHQALLAVRGLMIDGNANLGTLAERLRIRHHSTVELVDRLTESGLIRRTTDEADRRRVLLSLTAKATRILDSLSATHLEELRRLRPSLQAVLAMSGVDG